MSGDLYQYLSSTATICSNGCKLKLSQDEYCMFDVHMYHDVLQWSWVWLLKECMRCRDYFTVCTWSLPRNDMCYVLKYKDDFNFLCGEAKRFIHVVDMQEARKCRFLVQMSWNPD